MTINFENWTKATGDLAWGAQQAIHDSLTLCAEGKIHLVHGQDYVDGKPCLINSVGQMLAVGGGQGIPSKHFREVVGAFDQINANLFQQGVNTEPNSVSSFAAEILLQNFGPMKFKPEPSEQPNVPDRRPLDEIIPEKSDTEMAESWLAAISVDNAPVEPDYSNVDLSFNPETMPSEQDAAYVEDPFSYEPQHEKG